MVCYRSAFMEQGYRISISHTHANALKTDAPNSVLWDIMRCWVKMKPVKVKPTSPAAVILSKEPKIEASFSVRKDANPPSRIQKLARFPENPEPNWGPKARAKRKYTPYL
ncbi:tRNA (guanine(26)-N(2))-dimethyltransferase [Geodia barretti]|uniref:tRNA (guanine(26)-N(2))-dimethyltransferase n=1 Tax=Geodia barretti TaxID=519541 RepID=A0AA35S2C2_GEOBA|nr:tRNA (guanine(26)-N(2))-dimethyltransferase [Geodia barretti]